MAAGCSLSAVAKTQGYKGGSVLLPCSCSDLTSKPQKLTWWSDSRNINLTKVLNDEHYSGRYQLFNNISHANLSLLISDLREEDQGNYRCSTEKEYRDIWLNVKVFSIVIVLLLVISGVVAFICWRLKGRRSGENIITEGHPDRKGNHKDQTVPDVSYSTVSHTNTAGEARVQINDGEKTEYTRIITN
ncbi:hypothetical protein HF521_008125 [Silurus meridionalis]|uniref:Ig-like domain-containing protein n=1 Tax=Silurus meridionalis TaxID=175797 RepID=A0A8T0AN60_SILME|nr:hypothetical protein HF521_008125 [Silurus meridionalis]